MKKAFGFPRRAASALAGGIVALALATGCMTPEENGQPAAKAGSVHPLGLTLEEISDLRKLVASQFDVEPEEVWVGDSNVAIEDASMKLGPWVEALRRGPRDSSGLAKSHQRRWLKDCDYYWCPDYRQIDGFRASNIRVYVSTPDLIPIVDAAIVQWNNSGSKIFFRRVTGSPYDTHVYETANFPGCDAANANTLGCADIPYSGKPGDWIQIRDDWRYWPSWQQNAVMVHELGHTMSLAHTNKKPQYTRHISGTPDTLDTYSVMRANVHWSQYMTYWDKMATRIIYPLNLHQDRTFIGDANGDGYKDVVFVSDNGINVMLSNGAGGLSEPTLWQHEFSDEQGWSGTSIHSGDFNGDGRMDLAGFGAGGVTVALSTGSSYSSALWIADMGSNQGWGNLYRTVGDFNGDGRTDILGFGYGGALVALSNGVNGFSGSNLWIADFGVNQGWNNLTRMVGDFNGDGRDDILGFSYGGTIVYLSNGTNAFAATGNPIWIADFGVNQNWNNLPRMLGDFNGDGRDDILGFGHGGAVVALSNGVNGFSGSNLWIADFGVNQSWNNLPRTVGDFNGDGRTDILGYGYGGAIVYVSNGVNAFGATGSPTWAAQFGVNQGWGGTNLPRAVGDVNNDGRADIVGLGYNEFLTGISTGSSFNQYLGLQYRTY